MKKDKLISTEKIKEKAIIVGVAFNKSNYNFDLSLDFFSSFFSVSLSPQFSHQLNSIYN